MANVAAVNPEVSEPSRSLADTIAARRRAMKVEDLAELLGLAPTTIYDMARNGRLPSFRVGSAIRLDPKAVADWLRKAGG
jgi:excisionase family DNA binding protein